MRFFQTILAAASIVAAAIAQDTLAINDFPSKVEAGKSYTITYSPKTNTPTTFILRKGARDDLDTVTTLTETAVGGSYTWNVDADLPNADDYAVEIRQGEQVNYWGPFALSGGAASSSSASASSTSSASSSESSEASSSESASTTGSSVSSSLSATVTPSSSGNSTSSSASATRTPSSSATDASSPPESTGAASVFSSSPLALVFGAIAAIAYIN